MMSSRASITLALAIACAGTASSPHSQTLHAASAYSSANSWSGTDSAIEAAFLATLVVDWKQTQRIPGFCNGRSGCTLHETNPILRRCHTPQAVGGYFLGVAAVHVAVAAMLPAEQRRLWQAAGIGLELLVIGHNKRLGLSAKF